MNTQTSEEIRKTEHQWRFVADVTPRLVCVVDGEGRVLRANRTLERWGLGAPEAAEGVRLHDVLHRDCTDAGCTLLGFWEASAAVLEHEGRDRRELWDGVLGRQLEIRSWLPVREAGGEAEDFFAVVEIEDMSGCKAGSGEGMTSEWVRTEEALRATQNELWRLSAQHLTIQESERRRIAVDLHDGLGQTLSLVKLSIEEAARSMGAEATSKAAATLERLGPTVKSALAELRRISMNLRPSTLDDLGLLATLSWYFREFEAACPGVILERDISVREAEVPELLKITIFRIVQEAIGNALKHAGAERIKVCLANEGDKLELLVEDTGCGFDPAAVAASGRDFSHGLGLQSMKERAALSGARYELHTAPGEGTSICVRWPTQDAAKADGIPLPRPLLQSTPLQPFPDREMPDRYSACLACMRSLRRE